MTGLDSWTPSSAPVSVLSCRRSLQQVLLSVSVSTAELVTASPLDTLAAVPPLDAAHRHGLGGAAAGLLARAGGAVRHEVESAGLEWIVWLASVRLARVSLILGIKCLGQVLSSRNN